jgi:hypothetical protein
MEEPPLSKARKREILFLKGKTKIKKKFHSPQSLNLTARNIPARGKKRFFM